jgi:hypothetical protein
MTNEILPFGSQGTVAANDVLALSAYESAAERLVGNQPGIASRALVNTVLRQVSHVAAGLATFVAARYEPGVVDDGDLAKVHAGLVAAIASVIAEQVDVDHATRTDNPHAVTAAQLPDLLAHLREHAQATEALLGLLRISTTAEAQGLADNLTALTPLGLARAFGGSNQLLAAQGYQRLPGGLIVQMAGVNATTSGAAVTWPIAFPGGLLALAGAGTSELNTYSWSVRALTNGGATVYSQSGTVGVRLIVLGY